MSGPSVLFPDSSMRRAEESVREPEFFRDFNLDRIVAAVTKDKDEYALAPFFRMRLDAVDAVEFRHEVMRDLELDGVLDAVDAFASAMRVVRGHLARLETRLYERQKERWFLDAVLVYGAAVGRLVGALDAAPLGSRGLLSFRAYAARYIAAEGFTALNAEAAALAQRLSAIRYDIFMHDATIEVRRHAYKADFGAEVAAIFERFRQDAVKSYRFRFDESPEMNHVEAKILDGVAVLHPETFEALARFRATHADFLDPTLAAFDREIQFYVAYLTYISKLKRAGLSFCYPHVSLEKDEYNRAGFDLALADKLAAEGQIPVVNDFALAGPERIVVVTGPNQGGKTTFARAFGQLHYLASLGLPVPGTEAKLHLADRMFAHFERRERMTDLRGKLEDDLVRMRRILDAATPRTIVVINEIFASTTLGDAVFLSREIAAALIALDALCVWVTFIDEIASHGDGTVSMVSTVAPDDPTVRTFKLVRRPADGLAYAMSIAEKYGLTYDRIVGRRAP